MKPIVVIPTYNEIDNIHGIVNAVLEADERVHILIVDDNSPDGTSDAVKEMQLSSNRILLMERPGKMGLGTAYCQGFEYVISLGYDIIMEMDADFSHDPNDIRRFLDEIQKYDLVIGSRYSNGVNVVNWPLSRLILSYSANIYTRVITGMPIMDATGGFKCFRASALSKIDFSKIHSNGYAFQIEMNYRLWISGARIKEIPIIFNDRRSGVSKMNRSIVREAVFLVWKMKFLNIFGKL
ncbi:MAG: polyprenol monophosphomannose synthase [Candidatus Kapabacteria bacterium]|jgi:dolichol-phosphate mannosyltransferase|nr:polyprenol monophosphomannose synthase [Candidatus Kapabacteria bacterium]